MAYVKKNFYGGLDWHDIKSKWAQLKERGKYEINNVDDIIANDIKNTLPFLDFDEILLAIKTKTTIKFDIKEAIILSDGKKGWKSSNEWINPDGSISYENEGTFDGNKLQVDLSYSWGQFYYNINYYVYDIDPKDIRYVVENCFYAVTKGCSLIERIYVEPFEDLNDAKEYLSKLKKETYSKFRRRWDNEKIIMVEDVNKITSTDWYKHNIEAIRLMDEKKQTILDKSFSPFLEQHITNLNKL